MDATSRDETIAQLLAHGDVSGLELLFEYYYKGLCVTAFGYTDSLSAAEDIVRDEFVSFWEKKRGTRDITSVRAYLHAMVRNASLHYLRKHNRHVFTDIEDELNVGVEAWDDMDAGELERRRATLRAELDRLPPRTRQVVTSIVIDDMRYKEVAERMGISVNTVKTLYVRALKSMREHLSIIALLMMV